MNNLNIIMYHYVRDKKNSRYPNMKCLDIEVFEEQICYLIKNFNIISMDELICSVERDVKLKNSVLLTFDDGYSDIYTNVLPIFLKYNIKGAFYIPTSIFEGTVLDVNKIHYILSVEEDTKKILKDLFEYIEKFRSEYNLLSDEDYCKKDMIASSLDNAEIIFIKRMLQMELPVKLRKIIVDKLFSKYVNVEERIVNNELYVSKNQILAMQKLGMHIGCHGYDHEWLGTKKIVDQEFQIKKGLKDLIDIGIPMNNWTISYPSGSYNSDTIKILEKEGCKLGVLSSETITTESINQKFEFGRIDAVNLFEKLK
ncbi:MAG: polysaccharide deacetylase family protein [Fusobacteriaceae bacterium]